MIDTRQTLAPNENWSVYILLKGNVPCWAKDYFGELTIVDKRDGTSLITGQLHDIAAVYGLIVRFRDTGLVPLCMQVYNFAG